MATTQQQTEVGSSARSPVKRISSTVVRTKPFYQYRRDTGEQVAFYINIACTRMTYAIDGDVKATVWSIKGATQQLREARAHHIAAGFKIFEDAQLVAAEAKPNLRIVATDARDEGMLPSETSIDDEEEYIRGSIRMMKADKPADHRRLFNTINAFNRICLRARQSEHLKGLIAALEDSRS